MMFYLYHVAFMQKLPANFDKQHSAYNVILSLRAGKAGNPLLTMFINNANRLWSTGGFERIQSESRLFVQFYAIC